MRELPIARPKFRFSLLFGWARKAMRTVPCPIVSEWSLPGDYESQVSHKTVSGP